MGEKFFCADDVLGPVLLALCLAYLLDWVQMGGLFVNFERTAPWWVEAYRNTDYFFQ